MRNRAQPIRTLRTCLIVGEVLRKVKRKTDFQHKAHLIALSLYAIKQSVVQYKAGFCRANVEKEREHLVKLRKDWPHEQSGDSALRSWQPARPGHLPVVTMPPMLIGRAHALPGFTTFDYIGNRLPTSEVYSPRSQIFSGLFTLPSKVIAPRAVHYIVNTSPIEKRKNWTTRHPQNSSRATRPCPDGRSDSDNAHSATFSYFTQERNLNG